MAILTKPTLTFAAGFVLAFTLLGATPAAADATAVQIYLDQHPVELPSPARISDGRTLVPVRGMFEHLGATVTWDAATRSVTIQQGSVKIAMQIGSNQALVNDTPVALDVPPQLVDGRTMVL